MTKTPLTKTENDSTVVVRNPLDHEDRQYMTKQHFKENFELVQKKDEKHREKKMSSWESYRRKGFAEMRPYRKGETLSGVSVTKVVNPEEDLGMVARNPLDHQSQWYVEKQYFEDNFELVQEGQKDPDDYRERVIDENDELNVLINRLMQFMTTEFFVGMPIPAKQLLKKQLVAMLDYSGILGLRIIEFENN